MLSRQFAWNVVLGDHEIDHWSIVVAEVQQHARKRAMWVVRVHTLRYNCESNLNMHCAHRRYSLTLICAMKVSRSAYHSAYKYCAIARLDRHARRASARFRQDTRARFGAYESWKHPL